MLQHYLDSDEEKALADNLVEAAGIVYGKKYSPLQKKLGLHSEATLVIPAIRECHLPYSYGCHQMQKK